MFIGQFDPSFAVQLEIPMSMMTPEQCMAQLDDAIEPEYLPAWLLDDMWATVVWEEEECWKSIGK